MRPLQGVGYAFKPVWKIDERRIRYLFAAPVREAPDGSLTTGYGSIGYGAHKNSCAALDIATLTHALAGIEHLPAIGGGAQIILPVNFRTLSSIQNLAKFRNACADITEPQRAKLVIEIVDVPRNVTEEGLNGAIGNVLLFGAGVAIRKYVDDPKFAAFRGNSAAMTGFSLKHCALDEEALLDAMEKFVDAARLARLDIYAIDLPSEHAVAAATAMGVPLIGSTFVRDIANLPEAQQRYAVDNLYGERID